jgi:RimJ/RimL family protein N-acetyltransferase
MEINEYGQPVGDIVTDAGFAERPNAKRLEGRYVILSPLAPTSDVDDLYLASHGSAAKLSIWTYLPHSGPFATASQMLDWLRLCETHQDYRFFTVRERSSGRCVGMLSYCSIQPEMRCIEIGFVWYAPEVQRTSVNTESVYLLLCEALETMGYRRVEWKCDSLNSKSRAAALRLGFSYEGLFRQHRVVKNRNRDTTWFALTSAEWPLVKKNMETYLYSPNCTQSLSALNKNVVSRYSIVYP